MKVFSIEASPTNMSYLNSKPRVFNTDHAKGRKFVVITTYEDRHYSGAQRMYDYGHYCKASNVSQGMTLTLDELMAWEMLKSNEVVALEYLKGIKEEKSRVRSNSK